MLSLKITFSNQIKWTNCSVSLFTFSEHFLFVEFFSKMFYVFAEKKTQEKNEALFRSEKTTTTVVRVGHKLHLICFISPANHLRHSYLLNMTPADGLCLCVFNWVFCSCFWPYMSENDPIKLKSTVIFIAILYTNNPKRHSFV